jgi:hypothetical protein
LRSLLVRYPYLKTAYNSIPFYEVIPKKFTRSKETFQEVRGGTCSLSTPLAPPLGGSEFQKFLNPKIYKKDEILIYHLVLD